MSNNSTVSREVRYLANIFVTCHSLSYLLNGQDAQLDWQKIERCDLINTNGNSFSLLATLHKLFLILYFRFWLLNIALYKSLNVISLDKIEALYNYH